MRPRTAIALGHLECAALVLILHTLPDDPERHGAIATRKRQQMLADIRRFLDKHLGSADSAASDKHTIEIATAALLVETVRMDGDVQPVEREAALRAVRGKFHLTNEEARTLIDLAEKEARSLGSGRGAESPRPPSHTTVRAVPHTAVHEMR